MKFPSSITDTKTLMNGIEIPYLGLGVYKSKSGPEVINAIHDAFNAGYRRIDTATFYENEESVGKAIIESDLNRNDVFVTTKLWIDDQGYDKTLKAFDLSMKLLKLEVLDLYLIHWPVPDKYEESWKAMEQLYNEGRIRAIGVSNCTIEHLQNLKQKGEHLPMLNQCEWHPHLVQSDLLGYCNQHSIAFEGWSPLMRGKILDNELLNKLAIKYGKTVAQIILRWNLQKDILVIPKSTNKNRIIENSLIFDFEISEQDMVSIDHLNQNFRTGAHPNNFMSHFKQE
ncbi:aldo/keto reductase [Aegicerativicinus sediminis]|uniref:aldo/keto reductase n=1 Tax=Aegicerativicinus sediminis TaxID=2893202 RepID=UPI001E326424|nr:aldo/keto reductase [Aegicerativicinus sediminis]